MGLFGNKAKEPPYNHESARQGRNLDEAEVRYLEVLRREIANLIVESDPDLMVRCYEKSWDFERAITESPERAAAEEAALVAKFPRFMEFDLVELRHFIPYRVVRDSVSDDAIVDRYNDISRMLVFMRRRQEPSSKLPIHDAREHDILIKNMGREKARKMLERVKDAIQRLSIYRAGVQREDPTKFDVDEYQDGEVAVRHLSSLVDNEYGVAFKKTDEYAVYTFHVFDTGKIMHSYFRTDASFEKRESLG